MPMKSARSERLAVLQVCLAGICFGFLGIFARQAYNLGLSVGELITFRFTLATLLLALLLQIFRPHWLILPRRQALIGLTLGFFGYAVFSTLYFQALRSIPVPLAAMILYTFPTWVNLGGWLFLREPFTRIKLIGLTTATLGLVLLLATGGLSFTWNFETLAASASALAAAIIYAGYTLVSRKVQSEVRPLSSTLYVMAGASCGLWTFHQPSLAHLQDAGWSLVFALFGLAFLCTILPLTLFLQGLQKMSSSKAAILVMIEPVTAAVAASCLLGESLSLWQWLGAGFVLGGVVFDATAEQT